MADATIHPMPGTPDGRIRVPSLDPKQVLQLVRPRTADPDMLHLLAGRASFLAAAVEESWDVLEPKTKEALRAFAHVAVHERLYSSLTERAYHVVLVLKGETGALAAFVAAVEKLVRAVVDAIEREHPEYQKAVAEAVESGLAAASQPGMNPEEFREWLSGFSDRTLRGVSRSAGGSTPGPLPER